jgi:hypothetical protein
MELIKMKLSALNTDIESVAEKTAVMPANEARGPWNRRVTRLAWVVGAMSTLLTAVYLLQFVVSPPTVKVRRTQLILGLNPTINMEVEIVSPTNFFGVGLSKTSCGVEYLSIADDDGNAAERRHLGTVHFSDISLDTGYALFTTKTEMKEVNIHVSDASLASIFNSARSEVGQLTAQYKGDTTAGTYLVSTCTTEANLGYLSYPIGLSMHRDLSSARTSVAAAMKDLRQAAAEIAEEAAADLSPASLVSSGGRVLGSQDDDDTFSSLLPGLHKRRQKLQNLYYDMKTAFLQHTQDDDDTFSSLLPGLHKRRQKLQNLYNDMKTAFLQHTLSQLGHVTVEIPDFAVEYVNNADAPDTPNTATYFTASGGLVDLSDPHWVPQGQLICPGTVYSGIIRRLSAIRALGVDEGTACGSSDVLSIFASDAVSGADISLSALFSDEDDLVSVPISRIRTGTDAADARKLNRADDDDGSSVLTLNWISAELIPAGWHIDSHMSGGGDNRFVEITATDNGEVKINMKFEATKSRTDNGANYNFVLTELVDNYVIDGSIVDSTVEGTRSIFLYLSTSDDMFITVNIEQSSMKWFNAMYNSGWRDKTAWTASVSLNTEKNGGTYQFEVHDWVDSVVVSGGVIDTHFNNFRSGLVYFNVSDSFDFVYKVELGQHYFVQNVKVDVKASRYDDDWFSERGDDYDDQWSGSVDDLWREDQLTSFTAYHRIGWMRSAFAEPVFMSSSFSFMTTFLNSTFDFGMFTETNAWARGEPSLHWGFSSSGKVFQYSTVHPMYSLTGSGSYAIKADSEGLGKVNISMPDIAVSLSVAENKVFDGSMSMDFVIPDSSDGHGFIDVSLRNVFSSSVPDPFPDTPTRAPTIFIPFSERMRYLQNKSYDFVDDSKKVVWTFTFFSGMSAKNVTTGEVLVSLSDGLSCENDAYWPGSHMCSIYRSLYTTTSSNTTLHYQNTYISTYILLGCGKQESMRSYYYLHNSCYKYQGTYLYEFCSTEVYGEFYLHHPDFCAGIHERNLLSADLSRHRHNFGIAAGVPSAGPTLPPSAMPTAVPSVMPTATPSALPTSGPTAKPTSGPSAMPATVSSVMPTTPSALPTSGPTAPSPSPTGGPTAKPTSGPTAKPTSGPSAVPSGPSAMPTTVPTVMPTSAPSASPTGGPSAVPSGPSAVPTILPSVMPTSAPSASPTGGPSAVPSGPSAVPTILPSVMPTTSGPSAVPTSGPSAKPTAVPSVMPTSAPSAFPTSGPTGAPSASPTTAKPTSGPSAVPSGPSAKPTAVPSVMPTSVPSAFPTSGPTGAPSASPTTANPTSAPSAVPSGPSAKPTAVPSVMPTSAPSVLPTSGPTSAPSASPTGGPTAKPTSGPSAVPSGPSAKPTAVPSAMPTSVPSALPTSGPTAVPSSGPSPSVFLPTSGPTIAPSVLPTSGPSAGPFSTLTFSPTTCPSQRPTKQPTALPTLLPTVPPVADDDDATESLTMHTHLSWGPASGGTIRVHSDLSTAGVSRYDVDADLTVVDGHFDGNMWSASGFHYDVHGDVSLSTLRHYLNELAELLGSLLGSPPTKSPTHAPSGPISSHFGVNYGRGDMLSASKFRCMKKSGATFFLQRAYATRSTQKGVENVVDPNMCRHLHLAHKAGLAIKGIYAAARPGEGLTAAVAVITLKAALQEGCPHFMRVPVYLSITDSELPNDGWTSHDGVNRKWVEEFLTHCKKHFSTCGIHSYRGMWQKIFGDVSYSEQCAFDNVLLWYGARANGHTFEDFYSGVASFGQWESPTLKQFDREKICNGVDVGMNWF